ncbi:Hypothetical predicted protein, partial [Prunus dulcis]
MEIEHARWSGQSCDLVDGHARWSCWSFDVVDDHARWSGWLFDIVDDHARGQVGRLTWYMTMQGGR